MSISQEIKERISIKNYISRYVSLKQKGTGEYVGLCPFHSEKTPSFTVSEIKNFFHCFGCNTHGDVITFAMQINRLGYVEALKQLATEAGIKDMINNDDKSDSNLSIIYEANTVIANWYHQNLYDKNNNKALNYFLNRGISEVIIKKYQLGYATQDSSKLITELKKQFNLQELERNKLIKFHNGRFYDPLAGRIIFPIHNTIGKISGFGGRIIDDKLVNNTPKYINSTDNNIFHKSNLFYGIQSLKNLKQNNKMLIVVEGYFDVLAFSECNSIVAIAPLGTSIKAEQLKKLWSYSANPIICFDGDRAGQNAMLRVAIDILEHITTTTNLKFLILPPTYDPDQYVKQFGKDKFQEYVIESCLNMPDFLLKHYLPINITQSSPDQKAEKREFLKSIAMKIKNKILSQEYSRYFEHSYWKKIRYKEFTKKEINHGLASERQKFIINEGIQQIMVKETTQHALDLEQWDILIFGAITIHPKLLEDQEIKEMFLRFPIPHPDLKILRDILDNNGHFPTIDEISKYPMMQNLINLYKKKEYPEDISVLKLLLIKAFAVSELSELKKEVKKLQKKMITCDKTEDIKNFEKQLIALKKYEATLEKSLGR